MLIDVHMCLTKNKTSAHFDDLENEASEPAKFQDKIDSD